MLTFFKPKTRKQLRIFIGIEVLAPITELTSVTMSWEWKEKDKKSLQTIKKIISRETLLAYPYFLPPFEIHTDASNYQLGAGISQNNKPIAFYSGKLNAAQNCYTTTEK